MSSNRVATPREEIANAMTHGVGFLASLIGLPILVLTAAARGERMAIIGASVFGATLNLGVMFDLLLLSYID